MSRKAKKPRHSTTYDSHHLLWTRKAWNSGCRLLLRRAFVYEIPKSVHQELHAMYGHMPPLTDEEARWLWQKYKNASHEMDIWDALNWLYANAPNLLFMDAIALQSQFLREKMERS